MKYIDSDKLIAEIEKRIKELEHDKYISAGSKTARIAELRCIDRLIDSLQQEQPSSNLDEAAEDFVWEVMENDEDGISELARKLRPSSKIDDFYDALAEFFKAGAEWQKKQDELTWEDIKRIIQIADSMLTGTAWDAVDYPDEQKYYEEVLKQYKEEKK